MLRDEIMKQSSFTGSLGVLLMGIIGCQQSAANPTSIEDRAANQSNVETTIVKEASFPSYSYATGSGLELELVYQQGLKAQPAGKHVITVGHNGEGNLYMGNLDGVVKTLQKKLNGEVVVLRIFSKTELLDYLAGTDEKIDTVHSFGHGDDFRYWITGTPSDESLTTDDLLALSPDVKEKIRNNFAPDAYWKFYSCHGAADNGYGPGKNIVKTVAEVFGVKSIGANAWVFIETTRAGTYMYPASRARHAEEFVMRKPFLNIASPDPLYTQHEAAWVTYTSK